MKNSLNSIIQKYINGHDLTLEEIHLVETHLKKDKNSLDKITSNISTTEISDDLLIGIEHWAKKSIKRDISKVEYELYQNGFFINSNHIDQYLSGELDGELADIFDRRLKKDKSFTKEVEHHTDLLKGIATFSERRIKKDLDHVQKELEKEKFFLKNRETDKQDTIPNKEAKVVNFGTQQILAYAATVLLLIFSGWWFISQQVSDTDHFANHFQPYQDIITEEILDELSSFGFGETSEKEKLEELQSVMILYNSKSFQLANTAFEAFLKKYPNELNAKFYHSMTFIELRKYQQAIDQLVDLQQESFRLKKESTWYLALLYLKIKQPAKAKPLLDSISKDKNSPFQNSSQEILKNI